MSLKTRTLVINAIHDLGYRPNEAARALVRGRQSMVGIITSNANRYGYATTIEGIEEAARAAGLLVAITLVDSETDEDVKAAVDLMLGQPLAGVIVLDFDTQGERALLALPDSVPIAAVSSTLEGRPVRRVLFNDRQGGREATQYLLSLGHTTVHCAAVPNTGRPSGRLEGWREALTAEQKAVPEVVKTDWSPQSGYAAGLTVADTPGVTAVLCGNDEIAFGLIKALQIRGIDVPGDISVIGFDDHPHAALWTPTLTTMAQDFAQLGRAAFDILLGKRAEDGADASSPSLRLVVRESTASPAGSPAGPAPSA